MEGFQQRIMSREDESGDSVQYGTILNLSVNTRF